MTEKVTKRPLDRPDTNSNNENSSMSKGELTNDSFRGNKNRHENWNLKGCETRFVQSNELLSKSRETRIPYGEETRCIDSVTRPGPQPLSPNVEDLTG